MSDTKIKNELSPGANKVVFRLKKQLLTKRRFFYFSNQSEAEKELRASEFGGAVENSSVKLLKLDLKSS